MSERIRFSKRRGEARRKAREPKVVENAKKAFFLRTRKTSNPVVQLMTDLYLLKKPFATKLGERVDVNAFEDDSELERISQRTDHSLFCLAAHSKKRPHCLTLGRMYAGHVLDMCELGIDPASFRASSAFRGVRAHKPHVGFRPCFAFAGAEWESDEALAGLRNLLLDFFHGEHGAKLNLQGVRHVISCVALPERRVRFSVYAVQYAADGAATTAAGAEGGGEEEGAEAAAAATEADTTGLEAEPLEDDGTGAGPRVEGLVEVGPRAVLQVRRTKYASDSLRYETTRVPQNVKQKRVKNVTRAPLEGTTGTVYPARQDVQKLARARKLPKALRPPKAKKQRKQIGTTEQALKEEHP